VEFDASNYERRIFEREEDAWKQKWITVPASVFQVDGEVVAEAGSMLADDDEAKVQSAGTLYAVAKADPGNFNTKKAAKELLIAHGKRRELDQWAPAPPQPQPNELKPSLSIAFKAGEDLTEDQRSAALSKAGITAPPAHPDATGGPASPLPALVAGAQN
jgi:hypothetical protein